MSGWPSGWRSDDPRQEGPLAQQGERAFEIAGALSTKYNAMCKEESAALSRGAHLPQRCSPPKVVALPDKDMLEILGTKAYAAYFPRRDTVLVANSTLAHEYKTETLIHEMTHAFQSRAAKKGSCGDLGSKVEKTYKKGCDYIQEAGAYGAEKKYDEIIGKKWEFEGRPNPVQRYHQEAQEEVNRVNTAKGIPVEILPAYYRDIKGALKTPGILFRKG